MKYIAMMNGMSRHVTFLRTRFSIAWSAVDVEEGVVSDMRRT